MSFAIRTATIEDAAEICRLVRALAEFERLGHEAAATPADFATHLFGPASTAHAMVAAVDGAIVGMAIWFLNFSTFAARPGLYLEDLYVEPAHRGAGIGRAFFRALAAEAVARGCARLEWAVLDWNERAIAFYRSLGAIGMQDWTVQRLTADRIAVLAGEG